MVEGNESDSNIGFGGQLIKSEHSYTKCKNSSIEINCAK